MAVDDKQATGASVSAGRRVLVGTNVVVSIVVLAAIVVLVQWLAHLAPGGRLDMTDSGVNTLSDATDRLVRSLDTPVTLTSLYFETDREEEDQPRYRDAVDDLLNLYAGLNRGAITVQWINPLKDHEEYRTLLRDLQQLPRYAEQLEAYRARVDTFRTEVYPKLKTLFDQDLATIATLTAAAPTDQGAVEAIEKVLDQLQRALEAQHRSVEEALLADPPQYSLAVSSLRTPYRELPESLASIVDYGTRMVASTPGLPAAQADFLGKAQDRYAEVRALLDEEGRLIGELKPLELDNLTRELGPRNNAILVRTDDDARVVDFSEVWPALNQGAAGQRIRFANRGFKGEEKLTSALLRVTHKEQTAVVFVRYGGPPLLFGGFMPNQPQPVLRELKGQLEDANFVVEEWDLKTSLEPPAIDPAPTRTIYVVFKPFPPQQGPMGQPTQDRPFDATHRQALLDALGKDDRAMFITGWAPGPMGMPGLPSTYEYGDYLKETWGITVESNVLIVRATSIAPGKFQFVPQRPPEILTDVEVSEHPIVSGPNAALVFLPHCAPLQLADPPPAGVTLHPLMTQPAEEGVWGAHDLQKYTEQQGNDQGVVKVEGDDEGPFLLAVAGETKDAKVVVVSSPYFAYDDSAQRSAAMLTGEGFEIRMLNPGNITLMINSMHWLNDNEDFLNLGQPIEQSVLAVNKPGTVTTVRLIVLVGMPALALLCGLVVWLVRRG